MSDASKSANIKLCVSSRPHVVFTDTFAKLPKLRLQDLTHPDIVAYVSDVLLNDRRMERLVESNPEQAQRLADRVVTGASGVFLWVSLVVSSLLRGLGNRDDIHILHLRLDELPTDLSQLFHHMIQKVEQVYQSQASCLFQLAATVSNHLDSHPFAMLPLTLLGAHIAQADKVIFSSSLDMILPRMDLTPVLEVCEKMSTTVATHSGGLLEVQSGNSANMTPYMRISYIHRTVSEFMRQNDVHRLLADPAGDTKSLTFVPSVALLKASVLILEVPRRTPLALRGQDVKVWCINAVACAIQADRDAAEALPVDLIDRLYDIIEERGVLDILEFYKDEDDVSRLTFAAKLGLQHFLKAKLQSRVETYGTTKNHLHKVLWFALDSAEPFNNFMSPSVIHTLLEHGADPNSLCKGVPSLTHFLIGLEEKIGVTTEDYLSEAARIINDLLDHGARPSRSARVGPAGVVTDSEVVQRVFPSSKFDHLRERFHLEQEPTRTQPTSKSAIKLLSGSKQGSVLQKEKRWRQFWCFR